MKLLVLSAHPKPYPGGVAFSPCRRARPASPEGGEAIGVGGCWAGSTSAAGWLGTVWGAPGAIGV